MHRHACLLSIHSIETKNCKLDSIHHYKLMHVGQRTLLLEPENAAAALTELSCPPVPHEAQKADPLQVPTQYSTLTLI